MAITPEQVQSVIDNKVRHEVINQIESELDAELSDPQWLADWVMNKNVNPTYSVTFKYTLSFAEKVYIQNLYDSWGLVKVANSEDSGERSGACRVTLYTNKP